MDENKALTDERLEEVSGGVSPFNIKLASELHGDEFHDYDEILL